MDYLHVDPLLVESLSLSLLHSLWQGVVVACSAAIGFAVLRRSPKLRYLWGTVCLTIFAACPFVTFGLLHHGEEGPTPLPVASGPVATVSAFVVNSEDAVAIDMPNPNVSVFNAAELAHAAIVSAWVIGQIFIGCRLLMSACFVHRLKRLARPIPPELQRAAERLANRMGMRCPRIASSQQIAGAMAAGLLRQIVVVPTAWLAEMTPEMLEAVVAHELAHVKRYDLWVNLFQRMVESVLFFHPATWWLSAKIREQRELCCDSLAVQATRRRKQYAETLEHVARLRADRNLILVTQIGDDRMSLLRRVRFVLGQETSSGPQGWWPAGLLVMAIPCGLMFLGYTMPSLAEEAEHAAPVVPRTKTNEQAAGFQPRRSHSISAHVLLSHYTNMTKQSWPRTYVVEPPDVVTIELSKPLTPLSRDGREMTVAADGSLSGEYLVDPDGTINFGEHGRVYVSGMTMDEATEAVQAQLARHFKNPTVKFDVVVSNSKSYYVIIEDGSVGSEVIRMPVRGHDHVKGAIAKIGKLNAAEVKELYVKRPRPKSQGGGDHTLVIAWSDVMRDNSPEFPLHNGDRLFIEVAKGALSLPIDRHRIRLPIMGPLSSGGQANRLDPPTDKEILALVRAGAAGSELLSRENRDQVVITKELIADYVDPAQNYPLIGPAQMHHAHYKCTVALRVDESEAVSAKATKSPLVFVVDHQHLHADRELVVQPQEAPVDPRAGVNAPPADVRTKTYHVADLVLPIGAPAFSETGESRKQPENAKADFATLIELITTVCDPESWKKAGGAGNIKEFETNMSLVVSNSQETHDKVADLLQQVRRLQDVKTVLSATTLELAGDLMEELGLQDKQFAVLTKQEQKRIVTAAKADPHARTYPELKAKLFNGEGMAMLAADGSELAIQFTIDEHNALKGFATLASPGARSSTKRGLIRNPIALSTLTGDQTILVRMNSNATNPKKSVFRLITAGAVDEKERAGQPPR